MLNFRYEAPTAILFGSGQLENLAQEILRYSDRILLVYGGGSIKKTGLYDQICSILNQHNILFRELSGVQPNPRVASVREGVKICREHKLGFILAAGGGSTIDCSKHIAASVKYEGDPWDLVVKKISIPEPLPIGTILTLAATGSEMNAGAVISNDATGEKLPYRDDRLKPRFSILDPVQTYSVNRKQTAAGVADIMSHIFEQYFSGEKGTDISDRLAEAMLGVCIKYGPVALEQPDNYTARANLMWTSSLALNGLIQMGKGWGDWATHMIEHELSAFYDITHGEGLAILTPFWMNYVLDESNANKFSELGRNVWNITEENDLEAARLTIRKIREFFKSMGLPGSLHDVGINSEKLEKMASSAVRFGGFLGTFKKLRKEDVLIILKTAL